MKGAALGYVLGEFERLLGQGSPWKVFLFDDVSSTMDEARRLATAYPHDSFLVAVAETQHAGVGRQARPWVSPAEGVWMTALLRPDVAFDQTSLFTFAAAVAVADALCDFGFSVGIKWPNDVLAADLAHWRRKICGIRTEARSKGNVLEWVSMGIGINVNQDHFDGPLEQSAVSLLQIAGAEQDRTSVAASVLARLEGWCCTLEREGFAPVRSRWLELALGMGEHVCVSDAGIDVLGVMRGIDDNGHLLVGADDDATLRAVVAGDLVFEV